MASEVAGHHWRAGAGGGGGGCSQGRVLQRVV